MLAADPASRALVEQIKKCAKLIIRHTRPRSSDG